LGIKEKFAEELLENGLKELQEELDIAKLQSELGATKEQVVMVDIMDVNVPPKYFQVKNGKVHRLSNVNHVDHKITFVYLDTLLDILYGKYTVDHIFAWDGFRMVNGKWQKVVIVDGDVGRGAIIVKKVLERYMDIMKKILDKMLMKYVIRPAAKVKRMANIRGGKNVV